MWLTRDNHGYRLWLFEPKIKKYKTEKGIDVFLANLRHRRDYSMSLNERNIEDIFVKLDGGELEAGECLKVNLVEDDISTSTELELFGI